MQIVRLWKGDEMTLTGEMVGAEDALRLGLVNKVVEPKDLEDAAMQMAEVIARKSPYTVKVAKRAVQSIPRSTIHGRSTSRAFRIRCSFRYRGQGDWCPGLP